MSQKNDNATPRIGAIAATGELRVKIAWSAGPRAGSTEELDLSPIINAMKFFRPLRVDPELFAAVHPIAYGTAIAWGNDEEIDLSAGAILRLAEETMRPEDMRAFIARQGLTETSLAATLDYSRRQIVGFINEGRPIPRVVSLACRYIELVNPISEPAESFPVLNVPIQSGHAAFAGTSSSTGPVPVRYALAPFMIPAATSTVPSHDTV